MMKPVRNDTAVCFAEEWSRLPLRGRLLLTVYMVIGALGGSLGAHTVLVEFSHSWIAWCVSLIILEPVGLACSFGLIVLIFPRSLVSGWFSHALKRAKMAALVVGLIFVGALVG